MNYFFIRGRRSKINIASETLDPDRDITKPTNRTGDGNLEEDALELSDQARSRRYVNLLNSTGLLSKTLD